MKKYTSLPAFLLCAFLVCAVFQDGFAQKFKFKDYHWDEEPDFEIIDSLDYSAALLKDLRVLEYALDADSKLVLYETVHKVIQVNDADALRSYGSVYLPMSRGDKLINLKVRSIAPDGSVKELDPENIKDVNSPGSIPDFYTNRSYRIMAVEGLKVGGIVEYHYTILSQAGFSNYFGYEVLQSDVPIYDQEVQIITPDYLIMLAKSYNACPDTVLTDTDDNHTIRISTDYMPPLKHEKYGNYRNNLARVEYKINKRKDSPDKTLFTLEYAANIYFGAYIVNDKKALKSVEKLIKSQHFDANKIAAREEQVRKIESWIKDNIKLENGNSSEFEDIPSIIKNKYANERGVTLLYTTLCRLLDINYEMVLTTDKEKKYFDKDFNSLNYLEKILLYFPDYKIYIDPEIIALRAGFASQSYIGNYGMFIKNVKLSGAETGVMRLDEIQTPDFKKTFMNTDIDIVCSKNMANQEVDVKLSMGGYYASYTKALFTYAPKDKIEELVKSTFNSYYEGISIKDHAFENADINISEFKEPFTLSCHGTVDNLIETAGNSYIFKVGMTIGPQVELYEEEDRTQNVEMDYPHHSIRKIKFSIPEGYVIENPEKIKLKEEYAKDGETIMKFESKYSIIGNELKIEIYEYYKNIIYDVDIYPDFRRVINAAADFNKISVVLKPKKK